MIKPITPYVHGVIDYTTSAAISAAPRLMKFPRRAAMACYALAGSYTALSMLTDYPLAAKRLIPFKAHGATELLLGAALPAIPWMLGFANKTAARNFFIGLSAATGVVAAMTDWDKKSKRVARRRHKRAPRLLRHAA